MKHLPQWALLICSLPTVALSEGVLPPVDQVHLNQMVAHGQTYDAFIEAFEAGDELTEFSFQANQGVGANVGEGRRFTRFPRADLSAAQEWGNHIPRREGGPNATSCIACHNKPFANGAGDVALNVVLDPEHRGDPTKYLERNTLPLFALGIPQRLAEEISLALYTQRDEAVAAACESGSAIAELSAKGVSYGQLEIARTSEKPCLVEIDSSRLDGIDPDLVVKAFGWKGNEATIRSFTRGAAHNELGLQAVELVGDLDADFDGVTHELTVGDMTALSIYMAGLERPVSKIELADVGLIELTAEERSAIAAGEVIFAETGCSSCHVPSMPISDTVFREPSRVAGFYDVAFPDGSDPTAMGLTDELAISFDLAGDQPNNQIIAADGTEHHLGALETGADGGAVARWYTDFKRHDMGLALADPDDPLGLGASMFLTRSLAGVAMTGPWLHDGRATTLAEAISMHGGDAAESADKFTELDEEAQGELVAFLENLVMLESEEEEE
ncbi:MAG: di-heme oxidoredictase family protein [Pseudomonadota bacterium]